MSFPGSGSTALSTIWSGIKATTGRMKDQAVVNNAASSLTRKQVLDYGNFLADSLALLNSYTGVAGLQAYARNEENNATLNLASEYSALQTQIVATQDWGVTNFPNTSGELRVYTYDANKRFADIVLTGPQLTSYKNQLSSLIAAIN